MTCSAPRLLETGYRVFVETLMAVHSNNFAKSNECRTGPYKTIIFERHTHSFNVMPKVTTGGPLNSRRII